MKVKWLGQTCFRISAAQNKIGAIVIVVDPFEGDIKSIKGELDIALLTGKSKKLVKLEGKPFLIDGPGEYEVRGIFIHGFGAIDKKGKPITFYTFRSDGLVVCHLGRFGQKELNPEQLEEIGSVDVLMIPIGGDESLLPKEASKVIAQFEPRVVIPMNYPSNQKEKKPEKLTEFLKEMGIKTIEEQSQIIFKKAKLKEDGTEIVVLSSSN